MMAAPPIAAISTKKAAAIAAAPVAKLDATHVAAVNAPAAVVRHAASSSEGGRGSAAHGSAFHDTKRFLPGVHEMHRQAHKHVAPPPPAVATPNIASILPPLPPLPPPLPASLPVQRKDTVAVTPGADTTPLAAAGAAAAAAAVADDANDDSADDGLASAAEEEQGRQGRLDRLVGRLRVATENADPASLHFDLVMLQDLTLTFVAAALGGLAAAILGVSTSLGYAFGGYMVGPSSPLLTFGLIEVDSPYRSTLRRADTVHTVAMLGPMFELFRLGML